MKQLQLDQGMKAVKLDFEDRELPISTRLLRPLIYEDGDNICVVLGPDPQDGIFGCGSNTKDALKDWEAHLKDYLRSIDEDNKITQYIYEKIPGGLDQIT